MAIVNVRIMFKGNTEDAMNFYKEVFGGEFIATLRYGDNQEVVSDIKDKIAFMVLALDNETTIMACDAVGSDAEKVIDGNNVCVYINQNNQESVDAAFEKLKIGGKVINAPETTPWGGYFCELVDKFGISWIVNYQKDLGPLSRRP